MTSEVHQRWLENFHKKLQKQSSKILLRVLLDIAPCHRMDVNESNIKVVFIPVNITSMFQPQDRGIIKAIKAIYQKHLLQFFWKKMNKGVDVNTASKCVSVLEVGKNAFMF